MKELEITSTEQFISIIKQNCDTSTVYRGMSKYNYKLIPSLGRGFKYDLEKLLFNEESMMRLFKMESYPHIDAINTPKIELLGIAQHHGLKTRLLDWTRSALTALFFACEKDFDFDGAVYLLTVKKDFNFIDGDLAKTTDPFKLKNDLFFLPLHTTQRIKAQQGIFLAFANPLEEFNSKHLIKIKIPKCERTKEKILWDLNLLGINRSSLFPDMDGISNHLNWLFHSGY